MPCLSLLCLFQVFAEDTALALTPDDEELLLSALDAAMLTLREWSQAQSVVAFFAFLLVACRGIPNSESKIQTMSSLTLESGGVFLHFRNR